MNARRVGTSHPRVLFWFRVPDVELGLMILKRAELRCYLVVLKSIQRDRNRGLVSVRQAARRARINPTSAQKALASLVRGGWLLRYGERRTGYTYGLPFLWMGDERKRAVTQQPKEDKRANPTPRLEAGKALESDSFPQRTRKGWQAASDTDLRDARVVL
ncbi:MAG TPA: hypothetical protein VIY49_26710 [Bryobacteraceae bacterium]